MVKKVLSFDFGASSGRAILGTYEGNIIQLKEIHRFENKPVILNNTLCWDIDKLFDEVKKVLKEIGKKTTIHSIGIDTWGVDFGLLNKEGKLIHNPVHYRDPRTEGILEEVEKSFSQKKLYEMTGNQIIFFNTIFQLAYLKKYKEEELEEAESLLLMPDLFNYFLTGVMRGEETIASTTQLFDPYKKRWNEEIIRKLGFPIDIFQELVKPGEKIGTVSEELSNELGIPQIPVIATTSHDTASAAVSVPASNDEFLFISCGTWSLVGTELDEPVISPKTAGYNITNESGFNDKSLFMKNVTGLWVLQETKRQMEKEGRNYSYDEITKIAEEAKAFNFFIDTDHPDFQLPGDMPLKIKEYAKKTNQPIPKSDGEIFRTIYESLALKYRSVFEEIMECTGKHFKQVHIVGGGSQAGILCQMVANAGNIEVLAGPVEATVIGNTVVQLISQNVIQSVPEARGIIKQSFGVKVYHPEQHEKWNTHYDDIKAILEN
ncbi:rhamnulokinase [Oceanobacillus manasiensis]|uniref:rhamnulokinase n=1 Tax=Oceanobacillus manasiensis TaxID=586413 RepID=UPI0005A62BD3|nr:rhamnulokinase family protein [Oceanobacillus manasiensis]